MKQFVLDHFQSVYCANTMCWSDAEEGDLLIELATGQKIAIVVINRAVHFPEVKERFEQNTARKVHTLFLIDGRMMPPEPGEVEPPAWMLALHNLTNRRVYSYSCDGRVVTVRPLHFDWKWGSKSRSVQYGTAVDTSKLKPQWIETTVGASTGVYATVEFSEGVFWKKQEPNGAQSNYYSWRNWRYSERSNPRQSQTNHEENPSWESWDEFTHHYGTDEANGAYEEPRRQRQSPPRAVRPRPDEVHYRVLEVPVGAPFDEVKQAYRRKARENHPDLHPEHREKYTAKMAAINAAFEAIRKIAGVR